MRRYPSIVNCRPSYFVGSLLTATALFAGGCGDDVNSNAPNAGSTSTGSAATNGSASVTTNGTETAETNGSSATPSSSDSTNNTTSGASSSDASQESNGSSSSSTTGSSGTGTTDTSGASTDSSASTDESSSGSTGTGNDCKADEVYCAPGVCCSSAQECINNTCLDACPSKVRCGAGLTECCEAGELCHGPSCAALGTGCVDDVDCPVGQYCESTQGKCLPQLDSVNCELRPKFTDVTLDNPEWSWTDADVISIPVVADLDGDGFNEVVVSTTNRSKGPAFDGSIEHGDIVILSGVDGSVQVTLTEDGSNHGSSGRSTVAVADVDGDGAPDVIYAGRKTANSLALDNNGDADYSGHDSFIYAYSYKKGAYLWTAHTGTAPNTQDQKFVVHNGAITVANLDDDPQSEIVLGAVIIDHDGAVVWNENNRGEYFGAHKNYVGAIAAVADIKTGGRPEIITGRDAWEITGWQQGTGGAPATVTVSKLWDANVANAGITVEDGYPAIADLDLDKTPEVVLVAQGKLYVLESATGQLWCGRGSCANDGERTQPYVLPGSANVTGGQTNYGGPPTVADFDGDGRPEVGIADFSTYAMYDFNRTLSGTAETIPATGTNPASGSIDPGAIFTRWRAVTQDRSSSATGASVFDFQGDGAAEVVYADECSVYVYDGKTGSNLQQLPSSSATIHEYPLVVDVDNDKQTELIVVANQLDNGTGQACPRARSGVYVYGDRKERWVRTRSVWTQHTYHVTNADSQGNPPAAEVNNWDREELNNYRQNTQGYGVFDAPDLKVALSADLDECNEGFLKLVATVHNAGARGVAAGVEVNFFRGKNSSGEQIDMRTTAAALLPGASTQLVVKIPAKKGQLLGDHYVHVDGIGQTAGSIAECKEDNNADVLSDIGCPAE